MLQQTYDTTSLLVCAESRYHWTAHDETLHARVLMAMAESITPGIERKSSGLQQQVSSQLSIPATLQT